MLAVAHHARLVRVRRIIHRAQYVHALRGRRHVVNAADGHAVLGVGGAEHCHDDRCLIRADLHDGILACGDVVVDVLRLWRFNFDRQLLWSLGNRGRADVELGLVVGDRAALGDVVLRDGLRADGLRDTFGAQAGKGSVAAHGCGGSWKVLLAALPTATKQRKRILYDIWNGIASGRNGSQTVTSIYVATHRFNIARLSQEAYTPPTAA
jgi:hypothetical protein